ncbi:MAG: hypothetical protein M3X11_16275 [Acidobacteriota bacterium]|nr:hypothetical protein [Acidobacteriota bacterium]
MLADIIKIHCLIHRANFPMPRTSRAVICRESADAHTLSSNFPYDGQWVFCCNCQTFNAWEKALPGASIKECPFCLSSLNPRVYSCDHCAVTMVDFDDQTLRKYHAVLEWGAPQPACAGCHQFPHATPRKHFCQILQCELATGRAVCQFCQINTETAVAAPATVSTARLDAALVEAQARTREAEEAARKETELRTEAEHRVEEVQRRATRELNQAQASNFESAQARREAEAARAAADAEARARAEAERLARVAELDRQEAERRKAEAEARMREAEIKGREIEELNRRAEAAARHEAEMRAAAEQQTRDVAERFTSQLAESQAKVAAVTREVKKDRVAIALTTAIAVTLTIALITLIITLVLYFR